MANTPSAEDVRAALRRAVNIFMYGFILILLAVGTYYWWRGEEQPIAAFIGMVATWALGTLCMMLLEHRLPRPAQATHQPQSLRKSSGEPQ
jgi:hypothetical protein